MNERNRNLNSFPSDIFRLWFSFAGPGGRAVCSRLLTLWVRIPQGTWVFVCCECCALSGRGLCDKLITRPEESYRLWCVVVCDSETSRMRRSSPPGGGGGGGGPPPPQKRFSFSFCLMHFDIYSLF